MKYFTIFCFCLFISYSLHLNAQVPNSGFEDWDSNGEPVGWYTNNAPGVFTTITKSSDAHSGSWAVEGNVASVSGLTVGPAIIVGEEGEGIPINFRPASLKGYYKFNSVNNDYMQVQAYFFKDGAGMGVGAANLNPAGSYTQFSINIDYVDSVIPDTVLIAIFIAGQAGFANVGSQMFVDDLSWSNTTDVKELGNDIPTEFNLMQNYPNPFNPSTNIRYSIPEASFVTIKVYDITGDEIITLVNEEKTSGLHQVEFDASNLASGPYFYTIKTLKFSETKKMILMK